MRSTSPTMRSMRTTRHSTGVTTRSTTSALVLAAGLTLSAALAPAPAASQTASVGVDVVSRYVWRGTDFGESMSFQPALTFGFGGLEVGAWGSYSISASGADANENDLWASYTFETASGAAFGVVLTDYYFPAPHATGFSYTDAHILEAALSFSGPEGFPVSLLAGMLVGGDPDNSLYVEAGVPIGGFGGADVGIVAGMVAGTSGFYGTDGAALVNLGVSASQDLTVTESFALPISVSYIVNPDQDRAFLVFATGFSP